jgi:multimeric flavodoxin WrbA
MTRDFPRRKFLKAAGTAAATVAGTMAMGAAAPTAKKIKILAISGSLRKGKTTAAGLRICLDAAKAVDPRHIDVELIELSGLKIDAALAAGFPLAAGEKDDFPALAAKLTDPSVAGIIFGSPVYMGDISSVLKAFFERGSLFKKTFALRNKVGGALAVAGARNGGQENTIRSIQVAMFGEDMILVGDGRPTSHTGATLWSSKDDITHDEPGVATAKNLGRRVAEVALMIARPA